MIGREIEIGLAVEETRGTAPETAKWIKNISANVVERAELVNDEATRAVFEDADGRRVVKKHIEGDVEMPLYINALGYLAYNIYGAVSSAVFSGAYKHTFTNLQSSVVPSLSIFAKDGDTQQLVYKNGHLSTLELSATTDDYVKLNASFLAKDSEDSTVSPSYDTDYNFIGKEITVKLADSSAGLAEATAVCVSDLSITWDKGVITDHCLGSYSPSDFYKAKLSIEGSLTKKFEDETYKDLFLGNDSKYMEIKISGEDTIGTTNPTITLTLNKVQITDWNRSGDNDELVNESISFKAFYNSTDEKASQLEIINTTEEYEVDVSA